VAAIASKIDGIPEDVADERSALLVPPGDPEALALALGRLLTDAARRQRLASEGRAVFRDRFSADALTAALRGAYADLGVVAPSSAG
jgi:glycosyltransferase involved in cell wall biosynthesis